MSTNIVIVGVGLVSAVGLSAAETSASVRARVMRFAETDLRDRSFDRFTLAEVPDDELETLTGPPLSIDGLSARDARLLRLALAALRECVSPLGKLDRPLGLCLALPEAETTRPQNRAKLLSELSRHSGSIVDAAGSDASHTGRAGGLIAVGQAVLAIQRGLSEFMIAGGVDSYRDLYVLGCLDLDGRIKSRTNLDGFVPGEAAAFVLLTTERAAAARGLTVLARVSPVSMGFEVGHLRSEQPYLGDGLATTVTQLGSFGAVPEPIAEVFSSMNGESHWTKEWGVAYIRNKALFRETHGIHHPADCLGDTGAASGPLMVALAALGIARNYRQSPAMVYGSSDYGPRAAVIVSAAH
jgi:3-oxoacyl-[acyl-carrier-protein] synthase-1